MLSNLAGKKVLIRVDFNVPLNASFEITDDTRIRKAIPTITAALDQGAAVILASHLGRPQKKKTDEGQIDIEKFTLRHLKEHLSSLLDLDVQFATDTVGKDAFDKALNLKSGEVLLLENTRFQPGESKGDREMAAKLSKLADSYINDAFGTAHRAHASTATVAEYFKKENKSFGLLMQKEIVNADKVMNSPRRPFTAILGGAKVSDKIQLIEKLMDFTDNILIGGGMSFTFIKAQGGQIGNSLVEDTHIDLALDLMHRAKERNIDIYLPQDSIIADNFSNDANIKVVRSDEIPEGWMGLDIGPEAQKTYAEVIKSSKTILWNGPVGVFEFDNFNKGTLKIAESVASSTEDEAFSLVGGGDSVSAVNQSGLADKISYISTGGGALLEYLEGKKLPGIAAIETEYIED
ncbi:MAG: phosphoglycerate kinase [Saprospiraceae bacterium]|nr:phosphoglycerate kinase [Saprospiraceae bacterium]